MLSKSVKQLGVQRAAARAFSNAASTSPRVVLVDGARIPFVKAGTDYNDMIAQELGRLAIKGLLTRTAVDPASLDYVIMGNVIQEVRTSNIAREAALAAGVPNSVPSHTVTMACISANQAIATGAAMIKAGVADSIIAGGAETMSDVPIRLSRALRARLLKANKKKTPMDKAKAIFSGFKLGYLAPELPAIAEFSTNEVMGHSSDRLAARWGVSRDDQDEFAYRSHQLAAKAHAEGLLKEEIIPVNGNTYDNGISDASLEKMKSLKPAFVKPHGTHTAANSSYLSDGASATLIMSEERALALGYTPKAVLKDWIFVSQDPKDELLLGPAYAIGRLLERNKMGLNDVTTFELHEAFAGQVLSNLNALKSEEFCTGKAGLKKVVGEVPMERLNTRGGSLSIGHPFGATGGRLLTTTANRLRDEDGQFGLLAACAAGGQGHAMLVERYVPQKKE